MQMSDNELLSAISNMLDTRLRPIEQRLTKIETTLEEDVIPRLQNVEMTLEENVIPRLQKVETTLEENVIPHLQSVEITLDGNAIPRLQKIEISLEHNVVPRLQNIESCYVATYERYQSDADKMETVASDVSIIKKIVAEHSIKLSQAAI